MFCRALFSLSLYFSTNAFAICGNWRTQQYVAVGAHNVSRPQGRGKMPKMVQVSFQWWVFVVWLLADVACGAAVEIHVTYPLMGQTISLAGAGDPLSLQATFDVVGAEIGRDDVYLHVDADGDQVQEDFLSPMSFVQLVKLEPGTHTLAMQLRRAGSDLFSEERYGTESELLAEHRIVFDVVLDTVPLFFPPATYDRFLGLDPPRPYLDPDGVPQPIRVGVIASLKLDGQKTIWLEQFKHFPRSEYEFRFICYTANQANDGKMVNILKDLNIPSRLVDGLSISLELADVPDFPLNLIRLIRANTDIRQWAHKLTPAELQFMHDFFESFVVPLFGLDLVTFANARTEIDTLIVEAARLAGVKRIVMELPNLYPPQYVRVDALVAPSHFVKNHPSVVADPTPCFVINPGIQIDSFVPHTSFPVNKDTCSVDFGHCSQLNRPFRIGFVARLAPEKNPGLFVRLAAELTSRLQQRSELRDANTNARKVEFIIVGDGEIRDDLERFADWFFSLNANIYSELQGSDPILKFVGWVKRDELPTLMSTIDIIVNPSLRDSETFCIANLEAMAAGAALVTFANGGQSEYMRNNTFGFVVGPQPTVTGLANAVEWLMEHPVR